MIMKLQGVVDSAGVYYSGALALKLPPQLTVTKIAEADSPGYTGPDGSVRAVLALAFTGDATLSSYIRPTGSGGTSGLSVGRFDVDSANPYAPIPGTLSIGNDDGSDFALQIDGSTSTITSKYALTVNGILTCAAAQVEGTVRLKAVDTPLSNPASGYALLYLDVANDRLTKDNHDGTKRTIDAVRPRSVGFADSPITAVDGDVLYIDTTGGAISVVLPVALNAVVEAYIKDATHTVTFSCAGTVQGNSTLAAGGPHGHYFRGDGTNVWEVG